MQNTNPTSDYVEVHDGKVTVCRDAAKGKCQRYPCKYYHVPMLGGAAHVANLTSVLAANAFAADSLNMNLVAQPQVQQQLPVTAHPHQQQQLAVITTNAQYLPVSAI